MFRIKNPFIHANKTLPISKTCNLLGETNKTKAELYHYILQFHSKFKVGKEKIQYYRYRICFQPFAGAPLMNSLRHKVRIFAAISFEYNLNDFNISQLSVKSLSNKTSGRNNP